MLAFILVAVMVFTLAMMLVSFPVGLYAVFGTSLSNSTTPSTRVSGLNLDLVLDTIILPVSSSLGNLFLVFFVVYLAFFVLAARQGAGVLEALRASLPNDLGALFTNPLTAMMVLLGATSFVTQLVDTVQTGAGVSTGSLVGDPFSLLLDFTLAPLLEETTFRVVMIGVPVLVLGFIMFRNLSAPGALRALWRPSSLWDADEDEEKGGAVRSFKDWGPGIFPSGSSDSLKVRAIRPVVLVFLVLSSLTFGYAHYASGSGWGPGKVSEAAIAGLALGYLYIKYGFATSILFHWSVNYVGSVYSFLAQGLWGVPWTSSTGNLLDVIPTLVIVYLLGIPSTYVVVKELLVRRS